MLEKGKQKEQRSLASMSVERARPTYYFGSRASDILGKFEARRDTTLDDLACMLLQR